MANGDLAKGFVLGLGAALTVPVALVAVAAGVPPVRRAIGRTGLIVAEKFREGTAEMAEVVEDLVAEVQEQRRNATASAHGAPRPAPKPATGGRTKKTKKKATVSSGAGA